MKYEINLKIRIEDQMLQDILDTAIEGSINYWAEPFVPLKEWREIESSTAGPRKLFVLDKGLIFLGIQRVLQPDFQVNSVIRNSIGMAIREADAGEIDAEGADVIVQAAVFGEIVYG